MIIKYNNVNVLYDIIIYNLLLKLGVEKVYEEK